MNPNVEKMTSFIVMDVLERANELERNGCNIIHLEVGEPDFDMPDCIAQAAINAQKAGKTHYTHSLGDYTLRKTISEFYKTEYKVDVDPDCIVVTSGSSPAILMTLMLLWKLEVKLLCQIQVILATEILHWPVMQIL